ncbi:MAG TPA: FAD-binding protein [Planctomycetes bacterium]|nr:FAD-binding protein [Planctomycetota bacterium]
MKRLAEALLRVVGPRGLVTEPTRLLPYESDGLALLRVRPELVVLPRTTEEAARSMALIAEAGVPVVARGAGTGLTGGATPVEGGVVVSTARMRDILEVNWEDRFARVQAGVVNVDLTSSCEAHALRYAPDPSSQMACTIGGNVANNSGGPHCFKYGSTTRHIRGLVIVDHRGEVLDLSEPLVDPDGLDLVGLFVGSEGTFGIATEVTVALVPAPPVVEVLLAVFSDLDAACDTVSKVIEHRLEPSALEILDRLTIEAVESSVFAAGYPKGAEAVLLIEVEGVDPEVRGTMAEIVEIVREHVALEVRTARDAEERRRLWAGRKGAFGAMGRVAPDLYVADAVVPRTKLRELVRAASEICRERNLRLANVFHAGDGNLHPNICYDRRDADEVRRVLEAGRLILETCIEAGGSLTGEHGVGIEKREEMDVYFRPEDLAAMCRVRDTWDPNRRMNPDKLVPLRFCGELRTPAPRALSNDTPEGRR